MMSCEQATSVYFKAYICLWSTAELSSGNSFHSGVDSFHSGVGGNAVAGKLLKKGCK